MTQRLTVAVDFKSLVVAKKVKKLVTGVPEVMMGVWIVRRLVFLRDGKRLKGLCLAWGRET